MKLFWYPHPPSPSPASGRRGASLISSPPLTRLRERGKGGEGIFLLALTFLFASSTAFAQIDNTPPPLPVKAVTLFSSGVSYTLREGDVSGDATIPLLFRTAQINDILKSLVLLDEKGTVQPAIYAARDPIGRALQSFAVDVTEPMGRAELLNRLRGVAVTVTTEGGGTVSGQIVSVESKEQVIGEKAITVETLNLLGEGGLQSVRLDTVKSVRLNDDRLNREFREALSLLASGSDDKRRQVLLRFAGQGKRSVRVGYVTESPLWKISYRLLLDDQEQPYIQGWALVENTSDDDWKDVKLSLVSGRPVSFIQDLYQPLYLPRPVVPLDVVASPYPQLADGAVEKDDAAKMPREVLGGFGGGGPGSGLAVAEGKPGAPMNRPLSKTVRAPEGLAVSSGIVSMDADNAVLGGKGVIAQASGEKAGELFAYHITVPVSLPRQQAAMIPVIAQDIAGDKVSLYNADVDGRYPMNAVRLKNNTTLHLKGGPVTLFDNNVYAGDARMEDVPPGDSRLITYAVDLTVEGERQGGNTRTTETLLNIQQGILRQTRRIRYETIYQFRNKADKPRLVLVEHPFSAEQKLVTPEKASERTRDRYRFEIPLAANETKKFTVVTEEPQGEEYGLLDSDVETLRYYADKSTETSEKIKAVLRDVLARRQNIANLRGQADARQAEIAAITADQERIRKNMSALDKASALYKRYVTTLDQQETRIQLLRADTTRLRNAAAEAERELRTYLSTLNLTK